jgi:HSP20 family protein
LRLHTLLDSPDLFERFFGSDPAQQTQWQVPVDVFRSDEELVIRMDLPDVNPDEVELTAHEGALVINGTRRFPYDADKIRFIRRGTFYGDFTQRVALGKGLDTEKISAHYTNGVLELKIPFLEEVQPRRIAIQKSDQAALSS